MKRSKYNLHVDFRLLQNEYPKIYHFQSCIPSNSKAAFINRTRARSGRVQKDVASDHTLYSSMNKQTVSSTACEHYCELLFSGSFSSPSGLLLLPILAEYLAKAADRADLMFNSGSFLCWLASSVFFPSTSCSSPIERGSVLFWVGVSRTAGWVEMTRLNGSWKVSYSRLTWWGRWI